MSRRREACAAMCLVGNPSPAGLYRVDALIRAAMDTRFGPDVEGVEDVEDVEPEVEIATS